MKRFLYTLAMTSILALAAACSKGPDPSSLTSLENTTWEGSTISSGYTVVITWSFQTGGKGEYVSTVQGQQVTYPCTYTYNNPIVNFTVTRPDGVSESGEGVVSTDGKTLTTGIVFTRK